MIWSKPCQWVTFKRQWRTAENKRRKKNRLGENSRKLDELFRCESLHATLRKINHKTALTQSDALQILWLKHMIKCFSSTEPLLFLFAHYFQSDTQVPHHLNCPSVQLNKGSFSVTASEKKVHKTDRTLYAVISASRGRSSVEIKVYHSEILEQFL